MISRFRWPVRSGRPRRRGAWAGEPAWGGGRRVRRGWASVGAAGGRWGRGAWGGGRGGGGGGGVGGGGGWVGGGGGGGGGGAWGCRLSCSSGSVLRLG